MQFICYPKCTTCQKAKKWLEENDILFDERHIKENNPTVEELRAWHKQSNLPLKKFFNTSGLQYKALQLKDKLPTMSENEQYELLASDGMLVKRPILISDDFVLVGFKEADWAAALGKRVNIMNNKLVAYFSATGKTAKVAEKLAAGIGADIYEIKPEVKYTKADLNWMNKKSRSSVEMNNKSIRPAIITGDVDVSGYGSIYLGFPIWWYVAPTLINTFLEAYDFTGKKIVLFATSGSSGFGNTVTELQPSAPDAEIVETKVLSGIITEAKISALIDACN